MNAEAYIKSKLDGSFVSWEPNNGVFRMVSVPDDYLPPYARTVNSEALGNIRKALPEPMHYEAAAHLLRSGMNVSSCCHVLCKKFDLATHRASEIVAHVRREHGFKAVRGERP